MSIEVPPGSIVSGYRVERLIGRGATGAVYLARDEHLDRAVALKVLAPELARDKRFRDRFLRESRVAAALDNPHIVPIYAAGETDGALFLAMRYVDGSDLGEVVAGCGRLDPERTLAILSQVAEALDAAHGEDLIHRDVKPANILVAEGDRTFLCDFGLAKHAATINSLSRDTAFAGTIDYIAPEQIRGAEIDGRADIYALGCVLFECLTGRPPFDRDSDLSIVFAHLNEPPPSLSALRPDLPVAIDATLNRALAKEPEDRYRTCGELITSVRTALGGDAPAIVSAPPGATQLRTFLIADVRGYTRYTQQYGDEAAAELASSFAELVRQAVTARDGRLIELRGDEALVVFESARQALHAALEIQAAVADAELPRGVGIGLDAGEAVPVGKGYRGGALNMAARLCSLAQPGEVLASDGVTHLARKVDGVRYLEGRLERLKGIDHPVRVVEVVPQHRGDALAARLRRRSRGRPWLTLWAPLAVLVAAAVAATLVVVRSDSGKQVPLGKLHSINVLDVRTGNYAGSAAVGINASSTRSIAGSIWAEGDGVLYKIDPAKRRVQRTIAVGNSNGLAGGGGGLWLVLADRPTLVRVDARYGVVRRFRLPRAGLDPAQDDVTPVSVAFGAGSVWVGQQGRLLRIDPGSGELQGAPIETPFTPSLLTFGDGSVYLGENGSGQVAKIDPSSNRVIWKTRLHPWLPSMLAAGGYLWVTVDSDAGVHKFDERTGRELGLVHTGAGPDTLTYDGDHIWVNNWRADTVTSIDPVSGTTHSHRLPGTPTGPMAISHGQVWVPTQGAAKNLSTIKGDVLRVVQREDWTNSFDPARSWEAKHWQLAYAVEAKLFNYLDPDSTHAGNELTPELAAGWPKITDGGRTYTFKIRDGFRFSPPSNAPVTAATLKYSFERALSGDWAPATIFLPEIVGEQPFRDGAAKHVTGLVADGDTFTIRLTRPQPALPTILTLPFFAAVPIGTPADGLNVEDTPIPSAGPYYIASSNEGWWRILKRNPNYGGERPQHLDAVVYETGIDTGPAAKRIEAGTLDYASESYPDSGVFVSGGQISKTYGGERRDGRPWWAPMPDAGLRFFSFNVRRVFRDPDLRKAVAWAIDRPSLAAVDSGTAWDRMLPPTLPEVGTRHVYPIQHPDASSLARARSLMHGRHPTVVLATCPQSDCAERARILRDNLAAIGIRVKVRTSDDVYSNTTGTDIFDSGWLMDTFDAANILRFGVFEEGAFLEITGFDDPVWRAKVLRASKLAGTARGRAFARIDLAMTSQASPWAVFEQPADPAMFSDRVGCLEFSPVYPGPDLAVACIK